MVHHVESSSSHPRQQIPYTMLLGEGNAKKKIVKKAKELEIDMIVLGRRGMSNVKRCIINITFMIALMKKLMMFIL